MPEPVGLLSTLVPGLGLLNPLGSLITGVGAVAVILASVGGFYIFARQQGESMANAANAERLAALNESLNRSDQKWSEDETLLQKFRSGKVAVALASPDTACIPTHEEIARINAILGGIK